MFNENYYANKKKKITDKFEQKKNEFLQNLFNIVGIIQRDLSDLQQEHTEIVKEETESKKKEEESKKEVKIDKK